MKQLGRVLGNVLAVVLTVFALQAVAADSQLAGRNFDHMTTGFPLTGGHATAACETCHVAGVFKGTARTCDGCHALGRRVVATPKSTSHIVTDAPCETCHFNSSTFLGARYNHGTALPGQCVTCHNGRITTGRPANHYNGSYMQTASCDSCHRSYAFLPASWNHTGVAIGAQTCTQAGCHSTGNAANRYTADKAVSPVNHSTYADTRTKSCDVCHMSVVTWSSPVHEPQSTTCSGCHDGATAQTHITASHPSTTGTTDCSTCHTTTTWLGALGGTPTGHVINTAPTCTSCHPTPSTVLTGAATHMFYSTACNTCHYKGGTIPYTSLHPIQQSSHKGNVNCSSGSCHAPGGGQGTAYTRW